MQSIMHFLVTIILGTSLLYPNVLGIHFKAFPFESENNHYDNDYVSEEIENNTLNNLNESSSNNASEYRTDEKLLESASNIRASENFRTEDSNITFTSSSSSLSSLSVPMSKNASNTQSSQAEITLTEIFTNESNSTNSVPHFSGSPSSSAEQTKSSTKSTNLSITNEEIIVSSTEDEEEGVVRGKPSSTESTNITTTTTYESIYQKALSLINDTYTLSILLPVVAGIVFASTILITIATCKCLRRQCRRRRLRRKTLPDSVKNFRPSDRARLLAESSEEEF